MSTWIETEECNGCGLCISTCPFQAISIMNNKASIDQGLCTECLLCMDECPENAIRQTPGKDVELVGRESYPSFPLEDISPPARRSVLNFTREKRPAANDSLFLTILKRAVSAFFEFNSPPDQIGKGGKRLRRRERRGRRRS